MRATKYVHRINDCVQVTIELDEDSEVKGWLWTLRWAPMSELAVPYRPKRFDMAYETSPTPEGALENALAWFRHNVAREAS